MAVNQVIERANNHIKNVVITQADREIAVRGRRDERSEPSLILEKKLMTGKTNTP